MRKFLLGHRLVIALFVAFISTGVAVAQTLSAPTNPTGVTAVIENLYGVNLTLPMGKSSGGTGAAVPDQRLTLAAGVATWTFPTAYAVKPVCVASEEASTGHYLKITALSATAITVTSDVTSSNTDYADVICLP